GAGWGSGWGSGISGFFSRGMEFLKTNTPWLWALICRVAGWTYDKAAALGQPIANAASSIADAAKGLTGLLPSLSGAVDSITQTLTSVKGALAWLGAGIENGKWYVLALLGLVALLIVARVVRVAAAAAQA